MKNLLIVGLFLFAFASLGCNLHIIRGGDDDCCNSKCTCNKGGECHCKKCACDHCGCKKCPGK